MTKKTLPILLLLCTFFFASCKDTGSPQAVAEKFLFSLRTLDIETAKSLSTKNTWDLLNIMVSFADQVSEEEKETLGKNLKLKITDINKETDSTVIITYTSEPKFLPFNKIRMLKIVDKNGRDRWKVDISTLDLVEGEDLYIEEENRPVFDEEPVLDDSTQNTEIPSNPKSDSSKLLKKGK